MISCNEYDYIEIVCLYHYPIQITLKSKQVVECIALDTKRNEQSEECIEVSIGEDKQLIVLDELHELRVTVKNPHFQVISFF